MIRGKLPLILRVLDPTLAKLVRLSFFVRVDKRRQVLRVRRRILRLSDDPCSRKFQQVFPERLAAIKFRVRGPERIVTRAVKLYVTIKLLLQPGVRRIRLPGLQQLLRVLRLPLRLPWLLFGQLATQGERILFASQSVVAMDQMLAQSDTGVRLLWLAVINGLEHIYEFQLLRRTRDALRLADDELGQVHFVLLLFRRKLARLLQKTIARFIVTPALLQNERSDPATTRLARPRLFPRFKVFENVVPLLCHAVVENQPHSVVEVCRSVQCTL